MQLKTFFGDEKGFFTTGFSAQNLFWIFATHSSGFRLVDIYPGKPEISPKYGSF
jgi:hypothetical protein